jgi:ParB family chromosome partitioning protein
LQKLADAVPAVLAEGWKWAEPSLEQGWQLRNGFAVITATPGPLSPEDLERGVGLEKRRDAILEANGWEEPEDGDDAVEYQRIAAALEDIENRAAFYVPEEMALAGGWLTIDHKGEMAIDMGFARKEDVKALDALQRAQPQEGAEPVSSEDADGEDDETPLPHPAKPSGLSDALMADLYAARTIALRLEIANRPDIALRALAHSLAVTLLCHENNALSITGREVHIPAIAKAHCPDDAEVQNRAGTGACGFPRAAPISGGISWPYPMKTLPT